MAARTPRRDASGHIDPFFQRRRRFEAVYTRLGVADAFAALPRKMQELFWRWKMPDPAVVLDASMPDTPATRTLRREMEADAREATFDAGGSPMRVRDYISVLCGSIGSAKMLRQMRPPLVPPLMAFIDLMQPRAEQFHAEHWMAAIRSLYDATIRSLVAHARLDTRLLAMKLETPTREDGKWMPINRIIAVEPQVRDVVLDGTARPMYRAADILGGEVKWISWKAEYRRRRGERWYRGAELHERDDADALPVYVQSHALRQLHERLNVSSAAPYVEAWLAESLSEPKIVERQERDLLVEFRIKEDRLGYLVVTPLRDLVAVRTFKFLTMENTPEARKLEKKLKLTRQDIDWLGLHELSAFTRTDLKNDPALRARLESCGCGHLFTLEEEDCAPQPKEFAQEMKRYLRLAA
jgi:hypothetical protein